MFKGYLRANTAVTLKLGPFVDDTDGNTAETALTISQADVRLAKAGGNMAQKNDATSCTHDELGIYDCPIDATDTNTYGRMAVTVHESGALIVDDHYQVLAEPVYDSFCPASSGAPLPVFGISDWGVAQTSTTSTLVHRAGLALADDVLIGSTDYVYTGGAAGEARLIYDFTGASDTADVSPDFLVAPTGGDYVTFGTPPSSTASPIDANVTQVSGVAEDLPTAASLDTVGTAVFSILVDTGTTIPGQITALENISVADILTTQMTESYAADGVAPTLAQSLFNIQQNIGDFIISGTTVTVRRIDGATTAMTYTLDSATSPTGRGRTT